MFNFSESFVEWKFEYCWWEGQIDAIKEILFEKMLILDFSNCSIFFKFLEYSVHRYEILFNFVFFRVLKWWWIVKISD